MRAAVVTSFARPLEVLDIPEPTPGGGQVLVRIEATGLCHTDIHVTRADWPVMSALPLVPGHEGVGIVEALGSGVTEHGIGDRVAIPWLGGACGACEYCVSGWETLCRHQVNTGYAVDGTYAEYAVACARYVVRVPDGVEPVEAAPLSCAGLTTYKAVKVGRVRPTDVVAVFGVGGLGHLAVQYARIAGGTVVAVDVHADKLDLARELGASHTVNAAEVDPAVAVSALGGADVAIVTAAIPEAFGQALASLRPGGRLVCVGIPRGGTLTIPVYDTVLKGLTVVGSIMGTRQELAEVFELHAQGRTRVATKARKLDEVNQAFDDVAAGRVTGRVVFQM